MEYIPGHVKKTQIFGIEILLCHQYLFHTFCVKKCPRQTDSAFPLCKAGLSIDVTDEASDLSGYETGDIDTYRYSSGVKMTLKAGIAPMETTIHVTVKHCKWELDFK